MKKVGNPCSALQISLRNPKIKSHAIFFHSWKVRIGDQIHAEKIGNQTQPLTTANTLILDIQRAFLHPRYDGKTAYFDIAVVETGTVGFTKFISPVCLPGSILKVYIC
jgi:hypothetical protein